MNAEARERPPNPLVSGNGALPLFPPPREIACLYVGPVMHARLKPFGHRFSYKVASFLVDIDRLDELPKLSWLVSHNRRNLFSIFDRDLGAADGSSLRGHVDWLLAQAGMEAPARVLLLTYPRIAGYVFNPISVYYAYGGKDNLTAVIYEVRNTFGDRHTYVAPVGPSELGPEGLKQEREKLFHVSPFLELGLTYRFRLRPPGDTLALRILETDAKGPVLAATFHGTRKPLTTATLTALFLKLPFLTLKIVGAIHYEALKLWLKGARYFPRPAPPPRVSLMGRYPTTEVAGESRREIV